MLNKFYKNLSLRGALILSSVIALPHSSLAQEGRIFCPNSRAARIISYNEFTGTAPLDGARSLSQVFGNFEHAGNLGAALSSGKFVGVEDGELVFMDASGNAEQYSMFSGNGVYEASPGQPLSPNLPSAPQAGKNVLNSNFIDSFDDGYVYSDGDSTTSIYNGPTRTLFANQTWTAFSGGDLNSQAPSKSNILATEDGLYYAKEADGTLTAYLYTTGNEYVDLWTWTKFTGGVLGGKTLSDAVSGRLPNIAFLGIAADQVVFAVCDDADTDDDGVQDDIDNCIEGYNPDQADADRDQVGDACEGAVQCSDSKEARIISYNEFTGTVPLDGAESLKQVFGNFNHAGSLATALSSGKFVGVEDGELVFMDETGNAEQYSMFSGVGVYEASPGQPLSPHLSSAPQAGKSVLNSNFIDSFDDGYVYSDGDSTTSIYNGPTRTLFADQTWTAFSGGDLNAQAPSKSNILATEDGLYYAKEADGTLTAYLYTTGSEFVDLWNWTKFTGGVLGEEKLSDAVSGRIFGVEFLGIAADQMVFAVCDKSGLACANGIDDDADGLIDLADPGCANPTDTTETNPSGPACDNGRDDDGDSLVDSRDPGCSSPTDTTETNPTGPACDNGLDDDGDSLIDSRDPGCTGPTDTTETNPTGPACDNGIDDDADRLVDSRDPGCSGPTDTTETNPNGPACDNGRDDDSDSLIDARDPGCQSPDGTPNPRDTNEATQCQDAIDNDSDGAADALDPGCYDDVSDPSSYNPNRDNEGAASFDANRLTSPVYTKFNTFLGQSNFLELITSGTSSLSVSVRIYNLHGSEIARRALTLSANSQRDLDINSIVRQACGANPGCGAGAEDVDGDGFVDTYGLVRIDFDDQNPNVQLLGRLANYRQDPGKDSFSFAFARELRNASKNAATYATANTMDPQARGFLVANWSEIINIEKRQSFLYELFDISGNRVFSTSVTLNPRQEVDMHAGHELRNAAGQPIEGVYLARVTPQGDGEYLFTVARYSANGTSVANTDTYNYAFGVDGRSATGQAQFAFITNQEGAAWQEVNYLEIANTLNISASATVIYRGRNGELERESINIGPKSQVHINASAVLAQHGETSGTAVVSSNTEAASLIAQSLVYYQNKSDMMVEAAYFSAGKRQTGSLLAGSTNTFLNMSNTIRLASTTTASRTVVVNSKGFRINSSGVTQAINDTQNVTVGGNSSQSLLLSNISSIRENSYGPLTIRGLASGELVAEVLRVRTQENGQKIDYVMPTSVR